MTRLALLALLLSACTPLQWAKPDTTEEQTRADAEDCRQHAWRDAQWRSFAYGPMVRAGRWRDPFWGDRYSDESRLTRFCMEVRGYSLHESGR